MKRFRAEDGIRLAYRDEGEGLPVLALAGLTRNGSDFDDLAAALPEIAPKAGVRLIRLDSRGRGHSDWADPASYSVPQEARDALMLLDHLGLERVAVIGSSRGGLLGLLIAALARSRLSGLCLNDVGPVIERAGLQRLGQGIGVQLADEVQSVALARLKAARPGFFNVPDNRWLAELSRLQIDTPEGRGPAYDPALRQGFEAAMAQPLAEAWPLFDACAGLPLCLLRGANSDLLSLATVAEMRRRRPDMIHAEVADRGHIPFLDEPEALSALAGWLEKVAAAQI